MMTVRFAAIFAAISLLSAAQAQAGERPVFTVGALGDSISTAFDAKVVGNNLPYSWTTGISEDIDSHFLHLRRLYSDRQVEAVNVAIPGARTESLAVEVKRLVPYHPDYVTLEMGANDLCRWTDAHSDAPRRAYADHMRGAVEALLHANPDVRILLVDIPDTSHLLDLKVSRLCEMLWNNPFHPICPTILGTTITEEQRATFNAHRATLNGELAKIADAYPNNVRLATATADYEFSQDEVSPIDCFHPSVTGQKNWADKTWDVVADWWH